MKNGEKEVKELNEQQLENASGGGSSIPQKIQQPVYVTRPYTQGPGMLVTSFDKSKKRTCLNPLCDNEFYPTSGNDYFCPECKQNPNRFAKAK